MDSVNITGQFTTLTILQKGEKQQIDDWNINPEVCAYRELNADTTTLQNLSFGIHDKGSGKLIGDIGISCVDPKNKHAEIGLSIGDKSLWGKGYGTDAVKAVLAFCFEKLNLNKVYLDVWEENQRAIKCYLRCGFRNDGTLRQHVWKDGRYHNKIIMSILKGEWVKP
ncbi:MAG: GNAT family protein [Patescibacteria group bacterium]